jgi:uncharacterized protein
MPQFTANDVHNMALGTAILGAGGGGDPSYELLIAQSQLEKYGPVDIIPVSALSPDDLVVPIGFMGAPLVGMEKIPTGTEFLTLIQYLEKTLGKKASVLMPLEIGGGNGFVPFSVAGRLGLPILDADMMGRAFPELQMTSCHLHQIPAVPAFMVDRLGNIVVIEAGNIISLEKIARHVAMSMGSSAAFSTYLMTGQQAASTVVPGSVSLAMKIGETVSNAQRQGKDPLQPLLDLTGGLCIGSGKITDIDQKISAAFLKGKVTIRNDAQVLELFIQNEYLVAKCDGEYVATTPDILMLLEQESGTPLTSESLQYGIKVNVIALPSPSVWQTKKGLELVGPKYFGYDIEYKPFTMS